MLVSLGIAKTLFIHLMDSSVSNDGRNIRSAIPVDSEQEAGRVSSDIWGSNWNGQIFGNFSNSFSSDAFVP